MMEARTIEAQIVQKIKNNEPRRTMFFLHGMIVLKGNIASLFGEVLLKMLNPVSFPLAQSSALP